MFKRRIKIFHLKTTFFDFMKDYYSVKKIPKLEGEKDNNVILGIKLKEENNEQSVLYLTSMALFTSFSLLDF